MTDVLVFAGALAALVALAMAVNRLRGVKASYVDTFALEGGERVLLEDREADFHPVAKLGRAAVMSFARLKRAHAVLTNRRLIIGQKTLWGGRHMVTHVLYLHAPQLRPAELDALHGGLFSLGYQVLMVAPAAVRSSMDGEKPYVTVVPQETASATNVEHFRLYSQAAVDFAAHISTSAV